MSCGQPERESYQVWKMFADGNGDGVFVRQDVGKVNRVAKRIAQRVVGKRQICSSLLKKLKTIGFACTRRIIQRKNVQHAPCRFFGYRGGPGILGKRFKKLFAGVVFCRENQCADGAVAVND